MNIYNLLNVKCSKLQYLLLVVSVLATGPKVRGFDPDRGRWIFKGDKNPEQHFLRRGSKTVGPVDLRHVKEPSGMNRTSNVRKSHPSLLTACQMALAVTSGLSKNLCGQ
jgi:hypothetical protein